MSFLDNEGFGGFHCAPSSAGERGPWWGSPGRLRDRWGSPPASERLEPRQDEAMVSPRFARPDEPVRASSAQSSEPRTPRVSSRAATAAPRARPSHRAVDPIVVEGLTKQFGQVTAVDRLTFSVAPGRVTGFLGPNGAGKTTTLRMLVGLATPTSGAATFGGRSYVDLPRPQQSVGCVLEASFHPGRSGRNHLRILAATAGADDARVDQLLELVGLADAARRPAGGYSLGMKQRLALAGALLGDPDYLILDEPANGLDPEGIRWLRAFLRDFAATGRTVLVSSHMLNEVEATVDDIVVIGHGRLLKQAKMSDLVVSEGAARLRTPDLDRARRLLADLAVPIEAGEDDRGPYLRIRSQDTAGIGDLMFGAGLPVHELTNERYDLEEQFFAMLGDAS